MKTVIFEALPSPDGSREGESGWRVLVDGTEIIPYTDDLDIGWTGFGDLWRALGVEARFDYDDSDTYRCQEAG